MMNNDIMHLPSSFNIQRRLLNTKLFIIMAIACFFVVLSSAFTSFSKDKANSSLVIDEHSGDSRTRMLIDENIIKQFIQEMKEQVIQNEKLLAPLFGVEYEGTWYSPMHLIGAAHTGKAKLKIVQAKEIFTKQYGIAILFRLLENDHIDHWAIYNAYTKMTDLKHNRSIEGDEIAFHGAFYTQTEQGQYFSKNISSYQNCISNVSLIFQLVLEEGIQSLDVSQFALSLNSSSCGLSFTIDLNKSTDREESTSLLIYSTTVSALSLLTAAMAIVITSEISKNESKARALSIITISQSLIWNSYCCISYLSFAIQNPSVVYHFIVPSVLHMLNFAIVDMRLIYKYWMIKRSMLSSEEFQKQKIRFYLGFYLFFFLSFLSLNKFFFMKPYILVLAVALWLPQIVYNVLAKNNVSLPFVFVLIVTISRLFVPAYFKGYAGNVFSISTDMNFIAAIGTMVLVMIAVMYSQMAFGPRWFIPCDFGNARHEYYKTREELLAMKEDFKGTECVICLFPLFKAKENNVKASQNDKLLASTTEDVTIEPLETEEKEQKAKKKACRKALEILFDFYSKSTNDEEKEYMITPCRHVFHSGCLELWFDRKKECPNCRKQLNED